RRAASRTGSRCRPAPKGYGAHVVAPLTPLDHVGIVVRDIDAATRRLGLDDATDAVELTVTDARYGTFSARHRICDVGGATIELIQPVDGHSPYSDQLDERGEGPHHV